MTEDMDRVQMCPGDGCACYSDNADTFVNTYKVLTPMVTACVKDFALNKEEVFVICDYGSADGGTSIPLIKTVIDRVKSQCGNDQEINVIYEDQPNNDFSPLFKIMHGENGYLRDYKNVFVTACGTSFYSTCLPSHSVHLAISVSALHWLSVMPCHITGGLFPVTNSNNVERELFILQAAIDLKSMLLSRARELKPGGHLFIWAGCLDENGYYNGYTKGSTDSVFLLMSRIWKQFLQNGIITDEEFKQTTFCAYHRTVEEFKLPFMEPKSEVCKAGLKLCSIETTIVKGPLYENLMTSKRNNSDGTLTNRKYAQTFVGFMQKWSKPTMYSGLSQLRSCTEKDAIIQRFYQQFEDEVAASPEDYNDDQVFCALHVTKDV